MSLTCFRRTRAICSNPTDGPILAFIVNKVPVTGVERSSLVFFFSWSLSFFRVYALCPFHLLPTKEEDRGNWKIWGVANKQGVGMPNKVSKQEKKKTRGQYSCQKAKGKEVRLPTWLPLLHKRGHHYFILSGRCVHPCFTFFYMDSYL